jgi:uncharacterized protein (DUF2336 family)
MIVRHFLQWVRTAGAADRADATSALARAYLYSDLSRDDRIAAEGAMIMLLDDVSPLVRGALAEALAFSPEAPPPVILALAGDQPEIAAIVLERSPLLNDADLVDMMGAGTAPVQIAIARRLDLPRPVAAAIAEVGCAEACLTLVENEFADIVAFSLTRIVERFGHLGAIREAMFARADLPAAVRQSLVVKLTQALTGFVVERAWIEETRAQRLAQEACEKATIMLAGASDSTQVRPLVHHLRESGQLTSGLVLRALLSGHILLFEEALAELAELPLARVSAIIADRSGASLRALYDKAGMPASVFPAVRAALEARHEAGFLGDVAGTNRLKRRMVERVLTACEDVAHADIEPLLTLLRRFATEAAREEARLFCDELAAA